MPIGSSWMANLTWTGPPLAIIAFGGASLNFQPGDDFIGHMTARGTLRVIDFGQVQSIRVINPAESAPEGTQERTEQ